MMAKLSQLFDLSKFMDAEGIDTVELATAPPPLTVDALHEMWEQLHPERQLVVSERNAPVVREAFGDVPRLQVFTSVCVPDDRVYIIDRAGLDEVMRRAYERMPSDGGSFRRSTTGEWLTDVRP